jgi:hypothetical protein
VKTEDLFIDDIVIDEGTQIRASINEEKVAEYAEMMADDVAFEPVQVVYDGNRYILVDGFHRLFAHRRNNELTIAAKVENGTLRDAIMIALSANATHGLPRTMEDKRRSVLKALSYSEWCGLPSRQIAELCAVSHSTVNRIREELGLKIGEVYTGSVSAGRKKPQAAVQASPEPRPVDEVIKKSERPSQSAVQVEEPAGIGPQAPQREPDERDLLIEELNAEVDRLNAELQQTKDQLAANFFDGPEEEKVSLQGIIDELRGDVRDLSEALKMTKMQLETANISRDGYMNENAELKSQITYWQRRVNKLEKQAA